MANINDDEDGFRAQDLDDAPQIDFRVREIMDQMKFIGKMYAQSILPIGILYLDCSHCGKSGIQNGNIYTANHVNYNLQFFSVYGRAFLIVSFIIASENNFNYKIRNKFFNFLFNFVLCLIRAVVVFYYLGVLIPDLFNFYIDTWNLNSNNWWKSKSEPFFTNESIFNAFMCWLIWSIFIFLLQILLYIYGPFLSILAIFLFVRYATKNGCSAFCKGFFIVFYYFLCSLKNLIIGSGITAYCTFLINLVNPQRLDQNWDEQQRLNTINEFFKMKTKNYKEIQNEEQEVECAICLAFFQPTDDVVQLDCFKTHIYHIECLKSHLKTKSDCAMCKAEIDLKAGQQEKVQE